MNRARKNRMPRGWFAIVALSLAAAPSPAQQAAAGAMKFEVLRVRPNIYMLASPAGNVVVQVGEQPGNDGVLLVDTLAEPMQDAVLAEVRKLSSKPVRYIVDTSADAARTGGNEAISKAGKPLPSFSNGALGLDAATIIAQDHVLTRMSTPVNGKAPVASGAWPTLTFLDAKDIYFNGEPVQMMHQPAAHTDGDALVFFRNSNVLAAGEIFNTQGYPVVDVERGGSIQGIIDGLNRIIDIAVPADNEEGGTMIVPGRGRLCDEADVSDYRDMVTIIRDRVQDSMKKGKSLGQIQAERPSLDWDARYSRSDWTGEQFVAAIYKSLGRAKAAQAGRSGE